MATTATYLPHSSGRTDALSTAAAAAFLIWVAAGYWTVAPMSISVGVMLAVSVVRWVTQPGPRWSRSPMDPAATGWAIALLLSALFAVDRSASLPRLSKALFPFLVGLTAWQARDARLGRRAIVVLLVSATLSGVAGLVIYAIHGAGYPARARGPVGHYITFGGQLMIACCTGIAVALRARDRRERVLASLAVVICGAALAFTYTRSSWLGLIAGVALMLALTRPLGLAGLLAAVVAAALFAPGSFRARLLSAFQPGNAVNQQRELMWQAGARMFRDHPITGVGLQDLHPLYERYKSPGAWEPAGHLHSVPVQVAATMGTVGLIALLGLIVGLALTTGWHLRARARGRGLDSAIALAAAAAVLGFLVAGLFEWNLGDEEVLHPLYALVGLAWAARGWGGDSAPAAPSEAREEVPR